MKSDLTSEQIAFYADNGFVKIDGFLDDAELSEWRQAVDEGVPRAARGRRGRVDLRPTRAGCTNPRLVLQSHGRAHFDRGS